MSRFHRRGRVSPAPYFRFVTFVVIGLPVTGAFFCRDDHLSQPFHVAGTNTSRNYRPMKRGEEEDNKEEEEENKEENKEVEE